MSEFRSAAQGINQQFRSALRTRDINAWLALWEHCGPCNECHQEAGRPCLNLDPRRGGIHQPQPHTGRPSTTTEKP